MRFLGILWYHIATEDETKIALTSGSSYVDKTPILNNSQQFDWFDLEWGWSWPCCDGSQNLVSMITMKVIYIWREARFVSQLGQP